MALSKVDASPPTLFLPDVLANWPWPRSINPFFETVSAESAAWLRSFHAFSPAAQKAFDKCQFGRLASLAYPHASKDHLRTGCDLMNLFFVIDEHTDVVEDPADARAMAAVVMDALRHPDVPRPSGEWIGAEVARQFWARARPGMVPLAQDHFLQAFERYLDAVVVEAADRAVEAAKDGETVHTVETYLALRAQTIGLMPSLAVNLAGLDALTPADLKDPAVETLVSLGTTLIGLGNDLVSYAKERAEAAANHNVVSVVVRSRRHVQDGDATTELGTLADEQEAIHWVARYHAQLERAFLDQHAVLVKRAASSSASLAAPQQILAYADAIGQWVRSNDQWSFETERYFGKQGAEVQKSRRVVLRPIQKKATPLSEALEEVQPPQPLQPLQHQLGEGAKGGGGGLPAKEKKEGGWLKEGCVTTTTTTTAAAAAAAARRDPLPYSRGRTASMVAIVPLVAVLCVLVQKMVSSAMASML